MAEQMRRYGQGNIALAAEGLPATLQQWSVGHVRKWVAQLGVAQSRRAQEVISGRQIDGSALTWMSAESLVEMLCKDEDVLQQKATLTALRQLRGNNELLQSESAEAKAGSRLERLLSRAVKFGVLPVGGADELRRGVGRQEIDREETTRRLSQQLRRVSMQLH